MGGSGARASDVLGRRARSGVRVRVALYGARHHHAGLPGLPARALRGRRGDGVRSRGRVAVVAGRSGRGELYRRRRPRAGARPAGGAGARPGGRGAEPWHRGVLRRPHDARHALRVRLPARRHRAARRHGRGRRVDLAPRPDVAARYCGTVRRGSPRCAERRSSRTGSGCARSGPRCGSSWKTLAAGGCCGTTTGTAARACRCRGAVPARSPLLCWRRYGVGASRRYGVRYGTGGLAGRGLLFGHVVLVGSG